MFTPLFGEYMKPSDISVNLGKTPILSLTNDENLG